MRTPEAQPRRPICVSNTKRVHPMRTSDVRLGCRLARPLTLHLMVRSRLSPSVAHARAPKVKCVGNVRTITIALARGGYSNCVGL